jgi:hypothetical protein
MSTARMLEPRRYMTETAARHSGSATVSDGGGVTPVQSTFRDGVVMRDTHSTFGQSHHALGRWSS